jgi:hypothetical protein
MKINQLANFKDEYAMQLAQGRTFSHYTRDTYFTSFTKEKGKISMSLKEKALAKAAALRAGKKSTPAAAAKKSTAAVKRSKGEAAARAPRQSKVDVNWDKIVKMYNDGKSSTEISDAMGFTNKKSDWPYSYTLGLLKRLRAGVNANGKTYKIKARRG